VDIAIQVVPVARVGQDRAEVFSWEDRHVLVLADGAGGSSGGKAAADAIMAGARACRLESVQDCVRFLENLDQQLEGVGQATGVLTLVSKGQVCGASVGDSEAWLVAGSAVTDLTRDQKRKPLLGSGHAVPVGFGPLPCVGRLLLGSDGLFKYVQPERIRDLVSRTSVAETPGALVDAARLPSGALQDDIAVIIAGPQGIRT
jgi:serine/threonine protein phosphatase PrpC